MTDEQLDEQVHEAYAQVELSKEAEDRILANLLAAERASLQGEPAQVEETPQATQAPRAEKASRAKVPARLRRGWRWVAPASIAAVLIIGVFVSTQLRPSNSADFATRSVGVEEAAESPEALMSEKATGDADESEGKDVMPMSSAEDSYDAGAVLEMQHAEVIVLEDGRRFAITDLYDPNGTGSREPDWQPAVVEETGDACEAAPLDDTTVLVRFEGEDTCYLAAEV